MGHRSATADSVPERRGLRARRWLDRTRALRLAGSERGDTLGEVVVSIAITGILAAGLFASLSAATLSANALTRQDRLRNELLGAVTAVQTAAYVNAPPPYPNSTAYIDRVPTSKGVAFTVTVEDQPTLKLQVIKIVAAAGSDTLTQTVFKEQR